MANRHPTLLSLFYHENNRFSEESLLATVVIFAFGTVRFAETSGYVMRLNLKRSMKEGTKGLKSALKSPSGVEVQLIWRLREGRPYEYHGLRHESI